MPLDSDSVSRQDALAMLSFGDVGPCFVGMQNQLPPDGCQPYDLSSIFLREFDILEAGSSLQKINM